MSETLEQQLQRLLAEAPQDGKTPQALAAIGPVLLQVAQQLQQTEYYILQSINQNWQITTLQNRQQPDVTKTVIYGYAELKDATQAGQDPQLIAKALPTVDLLFQFMALPKLDSLILIEHKGEQLESLEIHQAEFNALIQRQLRAVLGEDEFPPQGSVQLA